MKRFKRESELCGVITAAWRPRREIKGRNMACTAHSEGDVKNRPAWPLPLVTGHLTAPTQMCICVLGKQLCLCACVFQRENFCVRQCNLQRARHIPALINAVFYIEIGNGFLFTHNSVPLRMRDFPLSQRRFFRPPLYSVWVVIALSLTVGRRGTRRSRWTTTSCVMRRWQEAVAAVQLCVTKYFTSNNFSPRRVINMKLQPVITQVMGVCNHVCCSVSGFATCGTAAVPRV